MNTLPGLPENVIYDICLGLNTKDLSNLMKSHSRIYQICSNILEKRLNERKLQTEIPLKNIIHTVKSYQKDDLGLIEILVQVFPVIISVRYSVKENPYVEFQSGTDVIRITLSQNDILRFVEFLRTLIQGEGNFVFQNFIFNVDGNRVIIHEIEGEQISYSYYDFVEAIQDVITYLSKRYYNLSIGIESEFYL